MTAERKAGLKALQTAVTMAVRKAQKSAAWRALNWVVLSVEQSAGSLAAWKDVCWVGSTAARTGRPSADSWVFWKAANSADRWVCD
jgi:hypothetical protein